MPSCRFRNYVLLAFLGGLFMGSQIKEGVRLLYSQDGSLMHLTHLPPNHEMADLRPPKSELTRETISGLPDEPLWLLSKPNKRVLLPHAESPGSGTQAHSDSEIMATPQSNIFRWNSTPPKSSDRRPKKLHWNQTMNACLFIMDDTIRLLEWLAYHYTVLPLGHLVVAIDPRSKRIEQINRILDMWRDYITIEAFYNDTFMASLDQYEGWSRPVWEKGRWRGWFKNKQGFVYRSQAHKRRQNYFSGYCFGHLYKQRRRGWTILLDTDEFLVYNIRHPGTENASLYDSETLFRSKEEIDQERAYHLPLRDNLPKLSDRVTLVQYLAGYESVWVKSHSKPPKCIRIPGVTFTSHESNLSVIEQDVPDGINGRNLMTLRQRKHGEIDGTFSKAMLSLKTATGMDWFQFGSVLNVHTPNRRMCGRTTKQEFTGSGADYISSLVRLHHYKAGTIESYLERGGDWRGGGLWRFYSDRNIEPVGENSDLTPWFRWFVDKVGRDEANKLLIQPLEDTYADIGGRGHIKEAKDAIARLVPSLSDGESTFQARETSYYNRTNHTIGACMYIQDDSMRLMEWIAYHYTVLPLSHLVVGLDPSTKNEHRISKITKLWKPFVRIDRYANDTWLVDIPDNKGWKRRIRPPPYLRGNDSEVRDWFLDNNSDVFLSQAHKRRQNTFIAECLREMRRAGHRWVLVTDSDEYIIFNYVQGDENPNRYDTVEEDVRTKDEVDRARRDYASVRSRLPPLEEHVTVADFIYGEGRGAKCFRLPSLNFSAHQDRVERVELPPSANLLVTLSQHRIGIKGGKFSKTLLDVTKVDEESLHYSFVDSVHNPNRKLCGYNGRSGSGADYIASPLRLNHYVAGSFEQYFERANDFRGNSIDRYLGERNFRPSGENKDIDYWIDWFIQKVNMRDAENLLFKPLLKVNKIYAHIISVKAAKTKLIEEGILPPPVKKVTEIDEEGNKIDEE